MFICTGTKLPGRKRNSTRGNWGHKYGNNLQSQEVSSNVACGGQAFPRILNPGILNPGILNPGILANALLRPTLAKALHLPADTFLGHRYGLLENVEVCNHGKVVGGECC